MIADAVPSAAIRDYLGQHQDQMVAFLSQLVERSIIEAEAREHDVVFVLEPAEPPHASLETWRKGV